jgi:hypothetical protein
LWRKATNWPLANEIDTCDGDLVVVAGNTVLTENHLISPYDLFGLNPKQLNMQLRRKKMGPHEPMAPQDSTIIFKNSSVSNISASIDSSKNNMRDQSFI